MEIDELRQKRLNELRTRQNQTAKTEADEAAAAERINAMLHQVLTDDAYARLSNIKMAHAERHQAIVQSLLYATQNARVKQKITDEQLKQMLVKLMPQKREIKIKRIQKRDRDG